MTSIQQQKLDAQACIEVIIMNAYRRGTDLEKESITLDLLRRLVNKMTLNELQNWIHGIALRDYARDRIKETQNGTETT